MCNVAKEEMKSVSSDVLGSWERAIVTSDGVWHTRGHLSKNGFFVVKNYISGGLLWYGHKCMKGRDDLIEHELYQGTSKSMEGTIMAKSLGTLWYFPIQKCIRGTKHSTLLPSPPPTQTMLSPEAKMLPLDFNIDWGR